MRRFLQVISIAALLVTIGPPLIYLVGRMEMPTLKLLMLIATVTWFIVAPFAWERRSVKPHEPTLKSDTPGSHAM